MGLLALTLRTKVILFVVQYRLNLFVGPSDDQHGTPWFVREIPSINDHMPVL